MSVKFPVSAFNFKVRIGGEGFRFSEVTGLKVTTEFKEVKAGGDNNNLYKIPMRTSCGEITFKRGVFKSDGTDEISTKNLLIKIKETLNFQSPVVALNPGEKKMERLPDITVILTDEGGFTVTTWVLHKPSIVSYEISALSASSNEIAFETLVIAPAGITID